MLPEEETKPSGDELDKEGATFSSTLSTMEVDELKRGLGDWLPDPFCCMLSIGRR